MFHQRYELWTKEEYAYPVLGSFIPDIAAYVHDEDELARPAIIVVPGGGYGVVSPTEGEIVAQAFYEKGYNTFVVTYTTNMFNSGPLGFQPLRDLSKAVRFVRKEAGTFRVNAGQVTVCGFSAGGHLTGSLAVHHQAEELKLSGEYEAFSNRPDAVILSYPVISSGEFAHRGSFDALLGADANPDKLAYMSLEQQVTKSTPPVFLWHTATDEAVPVENSYLFADACKTQGVPFELHVFGNGHHGLSLCNQVWVSGHYGGDYTLQQMYAGLQEMLDQGIELPEPYKSYPLTKGANVREVLLEQFRYFEQETQPDEAIALWPQLAHLWLKKVL
ncbi:alpha/beta hydrolase [Paenibacillus sp. NFR01]|uniref:alpha/beta hydrolase n=1 Tax=Paenibacillus sp. NFR01 TaxID=1566279 RepID=UPI000B821313|nr:alpha/beta hydrolase [Paenibacillus sp. NFR01]